MRGLIERLHTIADQSEMGKNMAGTPQTCRDAAELLRDHDRRVTELLEANNREVENRRMLARALSNVESDATAVLEALDDYNVANDTSLGGPPMFQLGRSIAAAREALERIDR